ncbi:MAG: hypothetical protein Q7U54_09055 [Bacteroidales bacterium]|nr:hypothetical protein [Bacteroidales bacterium]
MKPKLFIVLIFVLPFSVFTSNSKLFAANDTLSVYAKETLLKLNSALLNFQNKNKADKDFGAIYCTHCNLYHTRAAEAVFPFAYEYKLTGNKEKLKSAIDLGRWLIKQQKPTGEWVETPEDWTGTSTDQLLMLILAYPIISKELTKHEQAEWLQSFETAGDYLCLVMNNVFASINYCATTTATLSELYKILPKEMYKTKAADLAHTIVAKMNPEFFIEGEGALVNDEMKYGVDLGYNMEMSLWGLTRYALNFEDTLVLNAVRESLKNHIWFIYPNGALDGSWGIRSNKWTIYGSGTSDGCHPLLAMFSNENDQYRTAAIRNIKLLNTCITENGLAGYGPHHAKVMKDVPCVYPTFAKAKSMAMTMLWVTEDTGEAAPIETDKPGYKFFPSLNVAVIRTENICATITAYNYIAKEGAKSKYMHRPSGGSMSACWINGMDMFQVSSQTEYQRWEEMHFPVADGIKPLTPRIEFNDEKGYYTNLYEFNATFQVTEQNSSVITTVYGELRNRDRQESGIGYVLSHEFTDDQLTKRFKIRYETKLDAVRIIEPIVYNEGTKIEKTAKNKLTISYRNKTVELTVEGENCDLQIDSGSLKQYWSPYPAVQTMPVVVTVNNKGENLKEVTLTYKVLNQK